MQQRRVVLSLVVVVFVIGIIGYTPNVYAADFPISDEISCEALSPTTTWNLNRCVLSGPLVLGEEDILIINFGVTFVVSTSDLQVAGIITNIGTIEFDDATTLSNITILENFGTLNILSGSSLINLGEISGNGLFEINGSFDNLGSVDADGLINNFGAINNEGTIVSSVTFNHNAGATLTNSGEIDAAFFNINGLMNNEGTIAVSQGITTIGSAVILNNLGSIQIDELGTVEILGTINNAQDAEVNNDGIINNQGTFDNNGSLFIGPKGVFNNFGILQNNLVVGNFNGFIGLLSDDGATSNQFSIINNFETFDNLGTIFNSCGEINGSLSLGSTDLIDGCALAVAILLPQDGASFTNVTPITFLGLAVDKDAFGVPQEFSTDLVWTDASTVLDTGATFVTTLSTPPPIHNIEATFAPGLFDIIQINIGILDADGDLHSPTTGDDCDDTNNTIFLNAPEINDGLDNDCDTIVPDTEKDVDGDGYTVDLFDPLTDTHVDPNVIGGGDCNDSLDIIFGSDPPVTGFVVNPGAAEINDGIDNDCVGGIPFTETDDDSDGQAEYQGDCDDNDPARFLDNPEVNDGKDNDCDGLIANGEFDNDGDGYIGNEPLSINHVDFDILVGGGDCIDSLDIISGSDPPVTGFAVNPGAAEIPNGIDDNCDGIVDSNGNTDFDGDGFTFSGGDCDDGNFFRNPDETEIVDGIDNDCDFELLPEESDIDGDGYIPGPFNPSVPRLEWRDPNNIPLGDGDCDDSTGLRFPTNLEVNDGIDNDCVDGVPVTEIDNDNDGYTEDSFDPLTDTNVDPNVIGGGDCDDGNVFRNPVETEIVDGIDNDCNETLLPEESDIDGDGYIPGPFNPSVPRLEWRDPNNIPLGDGDCDDSTGLRFPTNLEVNDGIDNDCDGDVPSTEIDNDGDGYTEDSFDPLTDTNVDPNVIGGGDCDDTNPLKFPGAEERDNGVDDNCNGKIDEGLDEDGDGFTPFSGDCKDTLDIILDSNPPVTGFLIHPGALELPNGIDDDCDGTIDNLFSKFTTPTFQENLDEETIEDFEKMIRKLSHEIEKLEKKVVEDNQKAAKKEAKGDFEKADKLRADVASNESLIEINVKQMHVIDVSINNAIIDVRTQIVTYDNLTDSEFEDILDDIEDNLEEIEELEEKKVKFDQKAAKEEAKRNFEEADEFRLKAIQTDQEKQIIVDLNAVLICAIAFTPDLLENDDEHHNDDLTSSSSDHNDSSSSSDDNDSSSSSDDNDSSSSSDDNDSSSSSDDNDSSSSSDHNDSSSSSDDNDSSSSSDHNDSSSSSDDNDSSSSSDHNDSSSSSDHNDSSSSSDDDN